MDKKTDDENRVKLSQFQQMMVYFMDVPGWLAV